MNKILKKIKHYLKSPFIEFKQDMEEGIDFPYSHSKALKVKMAFSINDFKRKFLKEKWKYLFFTNTLIIIFLVGYLIQIKEDIQAATYGFNQETWSEIDAGFTATHDNDQSGLVKYYSKDANINTSNSNQISLTSASTTITESSTNDFNAGTSNSDIIIESDSIFLGCPINLIRRDYNGHIYCVSANCQSQSSCNSNLSGLDNASCAAMQAVRTLNCVSGPYDRATISVASESVWGGGQLYCYNWATAGQCIGLLR